MQSSQLQAKRRRFERLQPAGDVLALANLARHLQVEARVRCRGENARLCVASAHRTARRSRPRSGATLEERDRPRTGLTLERRAAGADAGRRERDEHPGRAAATAARAACRRRMRRADAPSLPSSPHDVVGAVRSSPHGSPTRSTHSCPPETGRPTSTSWSASPNVARLQRTARSRPGTQRGRRRRRPAARSAGNWTASWASGAASTEVLSCTTTRQAPACTRAGAELTLAARSTTAL
jgi:hypothetical protein